MSRIFFVFLIFSFSLEAGAAYESFFSPEDSLENVVVGEINGAKKTLDISIYSFSSTKIKKAIQSALKRGVEVRILQEGADNEGEFYADLVSDGVQLKSVNKINHHKFMIVDGNRLLNSSANFSSSPLAKSYDENMVLCDTCPEHVEAFQNEMDQLFRFGNRVGKKMEDNLSTDEKASRVHENYPGHVLFSSANFFPRFNQRSNRLSLRSAKTNLGEGAVESALIEGINRADKEILVATGHFRSKPLFDALARAVSRGVSVKVLLDSQEYVSKKKDDRQERETADCLKNESEKECFATGLFFSRDLAQAGVDVKIKYYAIRWNYPQAPQMHSKYMIVDQKTLYSGSYNWSYNAEMKSVENVAIYHAHKSPRLIENFVENFHSLYSSGSASHKKLLAVYRNTDSKKIPLKFEPMALELEKIDRLIALAKEQCSSLYRMPVSAAYCER